MKPFITLIKREWWEYRTTFLWIPVAIMILLLFLAVLGLLGIVIFSVSATELPAHWQNYFQATALPALLYGISIVFILLAWLTALSYFWTCLYNDRKDGSILFWQSMPISQTQTILSKLVVGLFLVPLVAWLCLVCCEFLLLIIIGIALKALNLPAMALVWQPGVLIYVWLSLIAVLIIQGLWLFPVAGWLMLSSAFAKRAPLVSAIVPPAIIIMVEYFIWLHSYVYAYIHHCLVSILHTWKYFFNAANDYAGNPSGMQPISSVLPLTTYGSNLLLGFLLGIVFLIMAGILRNRCYGVER